MQKLLCSWPRCDITSILFFTIVLWKVIGQCWNSWVHHDDHVHVHVDCLVLNAFTLSRKLLFLYCLTCLMFYPHKAHCVYAIQFEENALSCRVYMCTKSLPGQRHRSVVHRWIKQLVCDGYQVRILWGARVFVYPLFLKSINENGEVSG